MAAWRPLVSGPPHGVLTHDSTSNLPAIVCSRVYMYVFLQQDRSDSEDEQILSLSLTFKVVDFPGTQLGSGLV